MNVVARSVAVLLAAGLPAACGPGGSGSAPRTLLNASYDPTRALYRELGEGFARDYAARTGRRVVVRTSHAGSAAQARAILGGLRAHVASLALGYDLEILAERGWVAADWEGRFPHRACPYRSTIVFLVRRGNPRGIRGWDDLARDDVRVITANPKTSGGARWAFLAAWGHATAHGGTPAQAEEFVRRLYRRVPVMDAAARAATLTFVRKKMGDVLLAWENEAFLAMREEEDRFEIVRPEDSILAEPPVALVERNLTDPDLRAAAEAFVRYLYTPEAQEIIARAGFRPADPAVAERFRDRLPPVRRLYTVAEVAGSWKEAHRRFFADGALFDRILEEPPR
jgi:sulfate transport system substrate-binding protein